MNFLFILFLFVSSIAQAFTLVIDPGHGGKFQGPVSVGNKFKGKDVALTIALRTGELLKKHNITVVFTREEDTNLADTLQEDLLKRVAVARDAKADLFLSLHMNDSLTRVESRGYEIYVPMVSDFPLQSYIAAAFIHHNFSQKREKHWGGSRGNLNSFDRGIRAAKFNVLYHNPCPAVLIDLDYISNEEGEACFSKPEYRENIAQILAEAISAYSQYIIANGCPKK